MKYILLSLLLIALGCGDKPSETEKIFAACKKTERLSTVKHAPRQGDWLIEHPELYESVKTYLKKGPPQADAKKSILYIVRIGNFDTKAIQILEDTKKYLQAFYQINVRELDPITAKFAPQYLRQNSFGLQLKTSIILDSLLPSVMPDSAFALIGFALNDLYPDDDWNFVFGVASPTQRVGVWSMARYGDYKQSSSLYELNRRRTMQVAAHEMGHILGIKHCTKYECYMNGSNSLQESDRQLPWLCWECLAKICINRKINPSTQIKSLLDFHQNITHDERQISYYKDALKLLSLQ
jgi:archaemetzincin